MYLVCAGSASLGGMVVVRSSCSRLLSSLEEARSIFKESIESMKKRFKIEHAPSKSVPDRVPDLVNRGSSLGILLLETVRSSVGLHFCISTESST